MPTDTAMRPDRLTLGAFAALVLIGGVNAVAVRFSNAELAPFWGAAVRFFAAALPLLLYLVARRLPLPRGRAFTGVLIYGVLNFGLSYAFAYWGLRDAPAGSAMLALATVPLLTFLFAAVHGVERFRWPGLLGALVAAGGIAVVFVDQLGAAVPLPSLLAFVAAAACMAETGVVVKLFPRNNPVVANGLGMVVGAAILLALSLAVGEPRALPARPETWAALGYLVVMGSVVLFLLVLFVLGRWTASATSYMFLLAPLWTVVVAGALRGETVSPAFLVGGAIVLAGVYVGAFAPAALLARVGRAVRPAPTAPAPGIAPAVSLAHAEPALAPAVPGSASAPAEAPVRPPCWTC